MPGLDYSIAGLVAVSGGTDPWELARAVTDAHPDTLRVIGTSFRDRGTDATEVARSGAQADHALAGSYTSDGQPVFDAEGSGRQSRLLLSGDGIALIDTGAVYDALADDLTDAQNSAGRWLQAITDDVNAVIAVRNALFAEHGRNLVPEDADAADRGYHSDAARLVREGTARVQAVLDVFDDQVSGHTARLAGLPHAPPAAPAAAAPTPAVGPLEVAGALGAGLVNGLASLGNAIVHNPGEALALAGGVALAGVNDLHERCTRLTDALAPRLPELDGRRVRTGLGVGEWLYLLDDLCAALAQDRIPITATERDDLATTLDRLGAGDDTAPNVRDRDSLLPTLAIAAPGEIDPSTG